MCSQKKVRQKKRIKKDTQKWRTVLNAGVRFKSLPVFPFEIFMQQQHEPERKERFEDSCIRLKQKKKKKIWICPVVEISLFSIPFIAGNFCGSH